MLVDYIFTIIIGVVLIVLSFSKRQLSKDSGKEVKIRLLLRISGAMVLVSGLVRLVLIFTHS